MTKTLYLRKAALLVACCFLTLNSFSQDPLGLNCSNTALFCNGELDGYASTLFDFYNPTAPTPLCQSGGVSHNTGWISFVAGTPFLQLDITFLDCIPVNGFPGFQAGIVEDCSMDPFSEVACYVSCDQPSGQIQLFADELIPGKTYYLWVDGCNASICDFYIQVTGGHTYGSPSSPTLPITGPSSVCYLNQSAYFETFLVYNAADYIWTSSHPLSTFEDDNTLLVTQWPAGVDEVTICVEAVNDCFTNNNVECISVMITPSIPPTLVEASYCESDLGCFHEGVFYTEGAYNIDLVSVDGCDSLVVLVITEIPTSIGSVNAAICFGEEYVLDNQIYTFPVSNLLVPISTPSTNGCDSAVIFTLEVYAPDATITGPGFLDCAIGINSITLLSSTNNLNYPNVEYVWETVDGLICDGNINGPELEICAAGEYCLNVLVFDNAGQLNCSATSCYTVEALSTGPEVVLTTTPATCGAADGSIQASVTGSIPPYTYQWEGPNGPINQTDQLSPGNYSVTVTAANGCATIESTTILDASSIQIDAVNIQQLICFGDQNGSISITMQGGALPLSIIWEPTGDTTPTIIGLSAGIYRVTVTDDNNCSTSAAYTITEPLALNVDLQVTNVACYGENDGAITATVLSGVSPYTYEWDSNTGNQTGSTASGLSGGDYQVTITDANGCTKNAGANVWEPPLFELNLLDKVNVDCYGEATGEATLVIVGGVPFYNIAWSANAGGQTGLTAVGLSEGTYSATATDANGCMASTSLTIDAPTALTLTTVESIPTSCFGTPTGSATVQAQGGTPTYTYQWDAAPGNILDNMVVGTFAGDYVTTVVDANGCTATTVVPIDDGPQLDVSIIETQSIDCFGDKTGALEAIVGGGTGMYTYSWGANTLSNLGAGSYSLNVTDSNGCTKTVSYTLEQPGQLDANIDILPATQGQADGEATAQALGGTPPYFYLWLTDPPQASPFAGGLAVGNYQLLIKDANNCETWIRVTVPTF